MSADGRPFGTLELRALVFSFGCAACLSIDFGPDPSEVERSPARAIEELCKKQRYELEGSARRTEGITGGSCAFSVGPDAGVVRFIVTDAVSSPYSRYWFEVLLADEDGTNGRWDTVPGESHALGMAYSVSARIGETTRVIDVRLYAERTDPYDTGCSVGRRSRRPPNAP
jgi:hypothetical protein